MFRLVFRILKWGVVLSFAQVLVPLLIRSPQARMAALVFGCGFLGCVVLGRILGPQHTQVIYRERYPTRPDW